MTMSRVAVIGLGNMGAALARAFIAAGHDVTVWNRGAERRAAFDGICTIAATPAEACAASDLVVACLADYDATAEVLATTGVADALGGLTLVQLASGSPDDARGLAAWAGERGIGYLDGKILTYPARIGDEPTIIAYAGSRSAYDAHAATLRALGGRSALVAEASGGAAAVDLAWLSFLYGSTLGLLQGAAFCESEGVDPGAAFDALPSWLVEIAAEGEYARRLIRRSDFTGDQATLDVHLAAMRHILGAARLSGVDEAFPRLLVDIVSRAVARGHGAEEIAGVVQVLRAPIARGQ
jgi:3-hydroxyisobutyrate dehydrogenase-like beta-hydroxyacid dehydrogenase